VHAGKLGQVTHFKPTIVRGTAKHCIDQYMVLFHYCSLGGNTAMPGAAGYMPVIIVVTKKAERKLKETK